MFKWIARIFCSHDWIEDDQRVFSEITHRKKCKKCGKIKITGYSTKSDDIN